MAIATDQERLVVALEARVNEFEKSMKRASRTAGKQFGNIESRAKLSADRVASTFANFGKGLLAGVAAGGIAGIVDQIGNVAKGVAEIGDKAKMAGLSSKAFQELGYVARANRVEVDSLVDGMKELQLRADEYLVTGKGSAAESFQRLGYTAEDLRTKLQDPSALFSEIIGKLGQLEKYQQIRIADELFGGTGGEKFVQLIAQGEDGIRSTIQEAHNLGAVLSDDVIERAAEIDRKFNAVSTTVGTALKGAIVDAATALTDFINAFHGFEAERSGALDERLAALGKERLDVERQIGEIRARNDGLAGDGILGTSIGDSGALGGIADHERRMEAIAAEEGMILRVLEARRKATVPTPMATISPLPASTGSSSAGRDAAKSAAEREAEAVRRLIAELEEELRLIGASDAEKRASAILRQAGAAATEEERKKLVELNEQVHVNEDAQQRAGETSAFFRDAIADAFTSLIPAIKSGNAALDQFLNTLIAAVAQSLLLGSGPLGGLLGGGLLNFAHGGEVRVPRYAGGGSISGPGTGTSDSILARVSDGEFIVRAQQARKHRALLEGINAGAPVTRLHRPANANAGDVFNMPVNVSVNASGGTPEANADLARQTARETKEAVRSVVAEELVRHKRVGGLLHR